MPQRLLMTAEGGLYRRTLPPQHESCTARLLVTTKHPANDIGQVRGSTQIKRPLSPILAIAKRIVGAQPASADGAPRGDHRPLTSKHSGLPSQELSDLGSPLVNKIGFFHRSSLAWSKFRRWDLPATRKDVILSRSSGSVAPLASLKLLQSQKKLTDPQFCTDKPQVALDQAFAGMARNSKVQTQPIVPWRALANLELVEDF
jgi:hypothetical protein